LISNSKTAAARQKVSAAVLDIGLPLPGQYYSRMERLLFELSG